MKSSRLKKGVNKNARDIPRRIQKWDATDSGNQLGLYYGERSTRDLGVLEIKEEKNIEDQGMSELLWFGGLILRPCRNGPEWPSGFCGWVYVNSVNHTKKRARNYPEQERSHKFITLNTANHFHFDAPGFQRQGGNTTSVHSLLLPHDFAISW